jgi:hypothetical protein
VVQNIAGTWHQLKQERDSYAKYVEACPQADVHKEAHPARVHVCLAYVCESRKEFSHTSS